MLIKTKYIDCASKSVFNTWKLPTSAADTSGDIYWSAIVYIKDTGEVWTHGKLYGGFFSNADSNKVSLTIGGTTKILALDGHVQSYTTLTGSGSTADQAILSTGVANKWTLKTLGKNAFSNVDYLPADATAVAAEKVVHALAFQYNGKAIHSFDGSVARVLNIIQGDNVFITGDSQGNVTIAADPGSDTVNTAGATNLINKKLFLIGAESQTTSPQTYSNQYVYIGTDNCLYSLGKKVLTGHQAIYNLDLQTQVGGAVTKVTTFDPNAANNSFTLVQGTNVTLTPDVANKKVTISSKDTTYDFYNLVFKQGESIIDTYKPTTSPSKTLKAGTNVTFTGSNNEVLITTQDTRNTAGASDKLATKLFLTGSLTQTDNPQTYTNSKVYIGVDNKLYSDGKVVSTGDHTHNYAGATNPGGPALKVDLNPSGLLDAIYGSYGGILQDSNKGPISGSWSNRIKILHNNSTGYYTELAQNFTGTAGLWHRRNVAGTVSEWTPVIDKANFRTYLDSTYVIRGNDPNVLTNYVRYSIASGLTMNWEWGNATPTHVWGAKAGDSSKAYVFNGDNIRAFANAVNRAGDTMTGTLKVTEIQATNGNGLVMWNGTTYTYLGMQAGTTYIRSGATDLQHRYNGTDYKIWDARNLVGLRTEHSHNTINHIDNRETASTPQEHAAGVWLDFKANAKAGLSDGGSYAGLLTIRKYGGVSDWSGGKAAQLGFTDNSNVWVRFGSGASWENWKQLATTGWADGKFLPLTGGTVTGNIILKGSTNTDMTNANIHPRLRFDNSNSSQTVSFIFTDYDSYRAPAGIKLVGNQGNEWFEAPKLIKTGSSDNYVLLGGGGHKALAQFVYATGNLGVQESTGTSDNISRAQFWRDNNLGAYGVTLSHSDDAGYKTKIYHDYGSGGNLYMKACSNGTWGSVYTIWNSGNFDPNTKVNKAGDTMTGKLSWTMNGVTSSISNDNSSYMHHNTNASVGHWFNKNVYVSGNVYGGSSYDRILAFKDEINSQVGGSKSAQMNWASWGTDTYGGAIQIREKGLVTTTQSAWGYSPAISFHWGNRYARRFGLRSDGQFAVDDTPISLSTHNHNSLYVTALGTNGNYLTWTKNGTTNNITVPYASNADKLDGLQGGRNGGYMLSITLGTIPDYGYAVVGLVNLTNPSSNTSQQSLSIGEFGVYRPNAEGGINNTITFAIQRKYNSTDMIGTYYWVGRANYMKPVTFTYGGVKYGGFAVQLAAANGIIRMQLRYGDIQPFMVTYKTVNNGTTVNNSEINNSLVEVSTLDNTMNVAISKLGTATIGSSVKPIYLNGGTPVASTSTVGSATLPVYLNSGTITQCTASSIFSNLSNSGNNISITIAGQNRVLTPAYATRASYADKVRGEYTGSGGQQNPNYFGKNWVGFRMMNTTVGTNSQYKDWIISDCYNGTDVGGAVAFGMNRQSLGAYLMGSDTARTSWTRKGTFWGDWNLNPVPIGGIIMWSGSIASIPAGWALCNGSNGTPDLRNRFIVGAGSTYSPGNTGGLDKVTLALSEMPSHFHQMGVITAKWGDNANNRNFPDFNGTAYPNGDYSGDVTRWRTRYQGGSTSYTSASPYNGRTRGTTSSHENRPPYYALAYIMRIS